MMPTLPQNSATGFTLVELLVVLAIMTMAASLLVPRLNRPDRIERIQKVERLAQQLALARSEAIRTASRVQPDPERVPEGIEIVLPDPGARLTFYADGSASPALVRGGAQTLAQIDALTGRLVMVR